MTKFPAAKMVAANRTNFATYQVGDGLPILLLHGWPEIAYSWKNQMSELADAGYRAIAIDQKGFGASDCPRDKTLYGIEHLTQDFTHLLDALNIDKAIFCGHDWGGAMVWPMAQLHPDRVLGVIGVSTPHTAPPLVPPLSIIKKRFTNKHYFIQFQEESTAEDLFATDVEKFFKLMFREPVPRADWANLGTQIFDLPGRFCHPSVPSMDDVILSTDDFNVYVEAYKKSGFHGGINLYRNINQNYEVMKTRSPLINHASLLVSGEHDMFIPPESAEKMHEFVPNLERTLLSGCGHWVMWERPTELNAAIIDWLKKNF